MADEHGVCGRGSRPANIVPPAAFGGRMIKRWILRWLGLEGLQQALETHSASLTEILESLKALSLDREASYEECVAVERAIQKVFKDHKFLETARLEDVVRECMLWSARFLQEQHEPYPGVGKLGSLVSFRLEKKIGE